MTQEKEKDVKPKARLPRGFVDQTSETLEYNEKVLKTIHSVYKLHGFEALETPFFEYSDVLGKYLPDQDCPNAGVFSLREDDEQWLSLRYDLTAPLARYVAENFETLPKPYRSYRVGPVFRNEKPGPGRFRQFIQFDADIVGASHAYADAEICMMAAECIKRLGFKQEEFVIRLNNRKVLDGILMKIGLEGEDKNEQKLTILRAIDKWDKFGKEGVSQLLEKGRLDESGDFTKGACLENGAIEKILNFMESGSVDNQQSLENLRVLVKDNPIGEEGVRELEAIYGLCSAAGYQAAIKIDPSVVRGLEYYTGAVYEAELLLKIKNEKGQDVVFGSVGGGGRYDGLIARFRKDTVPATGFSIGVSRLITAMKSLGKFGTKKSFGPVVILAMDKGVEAMASYQKMAQELRKKNIPVEVYMGDSGMKAQMKYADRRKAPCVIIQGSREREKREVQIKDLVQGANLAKEIKDNQLWREKHPAQITVSEQKMIDEVEKIIKLYA